MKNPIVSISILIWMISSGYNSSYHENHFISQPYGTDSFNLSSGKKIFRENCSGCHGNQGQGGFGPNLCDNYWLHGNHYHNIRHTIHSGIPEKGMSPFKNSLNHAEIRDVAHFVYLNLKGTHPSDAKAPEGKKY